MSREDDEARLRAAGWAQRGNHWKAPWMVDGPDSWLNFDLAMAFLQASEATESTRDLARQALEANDKREAELAAMSPEDREKAIEAWATELAHEVSMKDTRYKRRKTEDKLVVHHGTPSFNDPLQNDLKADCSPSIRTENPRYTITEDWSRVTCKGCLKNKP